MNSLWQNVRSSRLVVLFSLALTLLFSSNSFAQPDGKALFKTNCSACHAASEKNGTGPGLKGVLDRIPGGDWKYNWVKNPAGMIKSGDPYISGMYPSKYTLIMTSFPNLKNDEIDAILNYASNPPVAAAPAGTGATAPAIPAQDQGNPVFIVLIILGLLLVLITALRYTKIHLRNAVLEKEGKPEEPAQAFLDASRSWFNNNKKLVALIGVLFFGWLVVQGWYAAKGISVYAEEVTPGKWVGYHPSQPINFSHKIHAGDNGIQCQYCHSTVEKSKIASIPAVNVCMNCHKVIQETVNPGSKEEIQKIYDAAGYDPESGSYSKVPVSLRWNKVHVLPDHVFFSHQQHVVVGGVACEQCHGDVKAMGTVEQQRPLTMGWCVDCHRNTPLKMEGNGYYTELHEKMKEKYKGQPITVAMAGGLECGRCHY